jgi:integrase
MAIYKRGFIYWYKFTFNGEAIRESTRQKNQVVARNMESAHRTSLAQGEVGIRDKKAAPTFKDFCDQRFEPWAKSSFEKNALNNWLWYRAGIRSLLSYKPLANAKLDAIGNELAAAFASHRMAEGLEVSTANSALRILRRALRLAAQWGVLEVASPISLLPGERHRERVVTREEQAKYLDAAPEPVKSIAMVLADSGLRPDECYRLRWEHISWKNGTNGTLLVTHGKTAAARRMLYLTPRIRFILETRWEFASSPREGWIWPAPTKCGHVNHASLKKQHARAFKTANAEATEKATSSGTKPILLTPWVLYSFRHTFLTRLGESGCDAWTLARIAGHSSIAISSRYVHPSEDAIQNAMSLLGGHKIGHSPKTEGIKHESRPPQLLKGMKKSGAPGEIRTPDLLLRRQSLYPAELRARLVEIIHAGRALIWY